MSFSQAPEPRGSAGEWPAGFWRLGRRLLEVGLLLVLPLVFSRGFAEQFSYPKIFLTQVLIIVGLAAWALGLMWGKLVWPQPFRLGPPLALLAIAVLLSSKNSPVPVFSLHESVYFLCGPAWVLLLVSWGKGEGEGALARLARLAALAGAVVAAIALLQWAGHDPLLYGGYRIDWGKMVARMRMYATFGNPNFVAGYLIGTIILALALGAAASKLWLRASWWAAAAAMLAAIVSAGSRGAWGGLAAGLLVAGLVWKPWSMRPPATLGAPAEKERRSAQVRGVVAPTAVTLVTLFGGSLINVLGRLEGRTYLWRFSWPMFAEHPLLGSGWGAYQLRYLELQARFLAAHPDLTVYWTNNRLLHNDPLQLLLETGMLGFGAFAWLLWTYGREARTVLGAAESPTTRLWLAAGAGGVTAMLVDSFFNFQFAIPPTFLLIFTLLAFPAVAAASHARVGEDRNLSRPCRDGPPGKKTTGGAQGTSPTYRALRLLTSVAVLVSAAALLLQRTRFAGAERDYRSGMLLEDRGEVTQAEQTYRHGSALNPLNGRLHFALARVLYETERYPEAREEVLLAERTYADSHTWVLKGYVQEKMGMVEPALETFRHALALDPTLKSPVVEIEKLEKEK
jgi:O-antigen ligase